MKLDEIESVGVGVKDGQEYGLIESGVIQGISMLPIGTKLYTAEQMQEYAKEKVLEAYQNISNYAMFAYLNNHEPIVPEAQEVFNDIFEEDTKND